MRSTARILVHSVCVRVCAETSRMVSVPLPPAMETMAANSLTPLPAPTTKVSLPLPPLSTSAPPPPVMVLPKLLPIKVLAALEPTRLTEVLVESDASMFLTANTFPPVMLTGAPLAKTRKVVKSAVTALDLGSPVNTKVCTALTARTAAKGDCCKVSVTLVATLVAAPAASPELSVTV